MEQKMLRVPFDLETAKKITNFEVPGRIVTRVGLPARIICWDKRSGNNMPIVALVTMKSIERFYTYKENGYCCSDETKSDFDLFVEMPENNGCAPESKSTLANGVDDTFWEQYRAMSAIATIQGAYNNKMFDNLDIEAIADIAIKQADALIDGLKRKKV